MGGGVGVLGGREVVKKRKPSVVVWCQKRKPIPEYYGKKVGMLTYICTISWPDKNGMKALAQCECGREVAVQRGQFLAGYKRSCGCRRSTQTHGLIRTKEYACWASMKYRCRPGNKGAKWHGDRGIKLCKRWEDFLLFLKDMGPKPSPRHSIDRIDVNGHYEPGNCRWATSREQSRNRRDSRYITAFGERKIAADWAEDCRSGTKCAATIRHRIIKGWNSELAITAKPNSVRRK